LAYDYSAMTLHVDTQNSHRTLRIITVYNEKYEGKSQENTRWVFYLCTVQVRASTVWRRHGAVSLSSAQCPHCHMLWRVIVLSALHRPSYRRLAVIRVHWVGYWVARRRSSRGWLVEPVTRWDSNRVFAHAPSSLPAIRDVTATVRTVLVYNDNGWLDKIDQT